MGYTNERVLEFLPWARRFARSCVNKLPAHLDRDDLQSAGVLGYLRAATRYDAAKGASFRGFCAVRIRGAVLDELRRWDWAPRSVHRTQRRITRVTSNLMEQLDREPTACELAHALGIDPDELAILQSEAQTRQVISLDEISENGNGEETLTLVERVADPNAVSPDVAFLTAEDRQTLLQCLVGLPKTQARVIVLHYLQNVPLRDVAALMGVTPSRISQLHHQALDRLRHAWKREATKP